VNQAAGSGFIRSIQCGVVPAQERLPRMYVPRWISQVAHGAFVLRQVERVRLGRHQRSGAGPKKSVGEARAKQGRNAMTSFLIIDAQSVKNTDSAEQKGYDAGKKVSGIKRHIAVDTQGLPHAIAITTAEAIDRSGAL